MATFDGSSLDGWSVSSATVRVDSTQGNPAPAIWVAPGQRATRSVPELPIDGGELRFDMRIPGGSNKLADFAFFCDPNGAGQVLRFEGRGAFNSGLMDVASWSGFNNPRANFVSSENTIPSDTWLTYKLQFRSNDSQAQVRVVRIGADNSDVICLDWTNFTVHGSYIGLLGDGDATTGAWFDNIATGAPAEVAGVAKLSSGAAASRVVFLDVNFQKVKETVPAADGSYSAQITTGTYYVLALGPDGYRPSAHQVVVS